MKNVSILLFSLFLIFVNVNVLLAHESKIPFEKVNPDNGIRYNIKRFNEKLSFAFTSIFDKSNIGNYLADLSEKREKELIYVVENEKISFVETASSRYVTTVGQISEAFDSEQLKSEKIIAKLGDDPQNLAATRDHFPANSAQWLLLEQAKASAEVLLSKAQSSGRQ